MLPHTHRNHQLTSSIPPASSSDRPPDQLKVVLILIIESQDFYQFPFHKDPLVPHYHFHFQMGFGASVLITIISNCNLLFNYENSSPQANVCQCYQQHSQTQCLPECSCPSPGPPTLLDCKVFNIIRLVVKKCFSTVTPEQNCEEFDYPKTILRRY